MKKLYISDLDGTLLLPGAKVGENTKSLINDLISKGANVTFCTARNLAQCRDILSQFNLELPVALVNGALVYDIKNNAYISRYIIPDHIISKILDIYKSHGHYPFMFRLIDNDMIFDYVEENVASRMFCELFGDKFKSVNHRENYEYSNDTIYLSSFETYEHFEPIYNELCRVEGVTVQFYYDVNTTYWLIEVLSSECNKMTATKFIKEYCGADQVVAFGDNDNDIPMIEFADIGVSVENGTKNLKNKANVIIGSNISESVPEFIEKDIKKC